MMASVALEASNDLAGHFDYVGEEEEVIMEDDDEYSYIEEVIEDDEAEDEFTIEEETVFEEIVVDDDEDDDDSGTGDYMDDDSSAPPMSMNSDGAFGSRPAEGGGCSTTASLRRLAVGRKRLDQQLEMSSAAVSEGARKAQEEALARERSIQRQAAKETLLRHGKEQSGAHNSDRTDKKKNQGDIARKRLVEEIRKVDQALTCRSRSTTPTKLRLPAADANKRKKALAELRRQAAREELSRNNTQLKATKISRAGCQMSGIGTIKETSSLVTEPTALSSRQSELTSLVSPTPSAPSVMTYPRVKDVVPEVNVPNQMRELVSPLHIGHASVNNIVHSHPREIQEVPSSSSTSVSIESKQTTRTTNDNENPSIDRSNNAAILASAAENAGCSSAESSPSRKQREKSVASSLPTVSPLLETPSEASKPSIVASQTPKQKSQRSLRSSSGEKTTPPMATKNSTNEKKEINASSTGASGRMFYSLERLRQKNASDDIDGTRREQYLSPDDFMATFHMTKEEFGKLPKWKRDKAKIKLKLF